MPAPTVGVRERVHAALQTAGRDGLKLRWLCDHLGYGDAVVRRQLHHMQSAGVVRRDGSGPAIRWYLSAASNPAPAQHPAPRGKLRAIPGEAGVRRPTTLDRLADRQREDERRERERVVSYLRWAPDGGWTARELHARLWPRDGALRWPGAAMVAVDGTLRRLDDLLDAGRVRRVGDRWALVEAA